MIYSELYSTLLKVFRDSGWKFAEVEGREVLRAGFEAHHTRVELHVQAFEKLAAVSVVAESPYQTENPSKRERLAELVMRVNETLTIGNFEMNWETGHLLFRVTNLFSTPQGDPNIIAGLVQTTVGEMDRIAPPASLIIQAKGPNLASLDLGELLAREDLLPEVPSPETL